MCNLITQILIRECHRREIHESINYPHFSRAINFKGHYLRIIKRSHKNAYLYEYPFEFLRKAPVGILYIK